MSAYCCVCQEHHPGAAFSVDDPCLWGALEQARATIALYARAIDGAIPPVRAELGSFRHFPGGTYNAASSAAAHRALQIIDGELGQ